MSCLFFGLDPPLCNFEVGDNVQFETSDSLVSDVIRGPDKPLELFLDQGQRTIRFYPFDKQVRSWDIFPLALTSDGALLQDVGIEVHFTAELVDWEERVTLRQDLLHFDTSSSTELVWPVEVLDLDPTVVNDGVAWVTDSLDLRVDLYKG